MFQLEGLDHVALIVRDVERSVRWYQQVLGLTRRYQEVWGDYPAVVCTGNTFLALFPSQSAAPRAGSDPDTLTVHHFAFRVNRENFESAQTALREQGVSFRFQNHEISHSIYFHDPDGHQVEITTYEI